MKTGVHDLLDLMPDIALERHLLTSNPWVLEFILHQICSIYPSTWFKSYSRHRCSDVFPLAVVQASSKLAHELAICDPNTSPWGSMRRRQPKGPKGGGKGLGLKCGRPMFGTFSRLRMCRNRAGHNGWVPYI